MTALAVMTLIATACIGCRPHHQNDELAGTHRDSLLTRRHPDHEVVVTTRPSAVGQILTDRYGHALYMFPPDVRGRVSCTGPCDGTWPTLAVAAGFTPQAAELARQSLLGVARDPNTGAHVVTYAGHPLYRYAGDLTGHTINGQGLFLDGGPWYLLTPAGQPITTDPAALSKATSR